MFKIEIERAIGGYILRITGEICLVGEGTYIFCTLKETIAKAMELLGGPSTPMDPRG